MNKFVDFLKMIKIEHSIFALPFAFTGAIIAANGIPEFNKILWIIVAMVGARTGAMGLNRVIDAEIDKRNPRTANREIPAGKIKKNEAIFYIIISFVVYEFATLMLNKLCFILSPIPLVIFILYSYTKRFTALCHIVLGVALGLAPIGAWVAIRGDINTGIVLMGLAVLFWVAGFDIIYALQDIDFDRKENLHSIPRYFGVRNSLVLSRIFHMLAFFIFLYLYKYFNFGLIYLFGILICGAFMFYQHRLIKSDDLSRVNIAFFNLNAYISLTVFMFTLLDIIF
ncbi:MAG: 4-hydroxybenzoate polyprenyltransferase [Deferribacteres bacterium]|jgi:4-hydroxybenzoate polyprenyltransferase|nr:4-hydroxybenzoate polyprenyltransferase [Deferribacteraceae bacterium]MDK2792070.1 4-hydroxybenzoate polyprenyltransferase [Deferribacteres bacterium]